MSAVIFLTKLVSSSLLSFGTAGKSAYIKRCSTVKIFVTDT